MSTRAELEKQKYESAINNLQNRVSDNSKVKEMENLKEYLTMRIDENNKSTQDATLDQDIVTKDANLATLKKLRDTLMKNITKTKSDIETQSQLIKKKDLEIGTSESEIKRQEQAIEYKKNLLLTRDRMLELSEEKNVYKKKVIFTLLAVIIAMVLLMILSFFYIK